MDNIPIQRTTESGYENKDYPVAEAIEVLNKELDNGRTLWIDGKMFSDECVTAETLSKCKKGICVTNKLIGG